MYVDRNTDREEIVKRWWRKNAWEMDERESVRVWKEKKRKWERERDMTFWPIFYQTDLLVSFYPFFCSACRIITFWKHTYTHTHTHTHTGELRVEYQKAWDCLCLLEWNNASSIPRSLNLCLPFSLFAPSIFSFSRSVASFSFPQPFSPSGDMWNEAEMVPQWWGTDKERERGGTRKRLKKEIDLYPYTWDFWLA